VLKTDWVDVVTDWTARKLGVLGTKGEDIGFHMRDTHTPALEVSTSSRPGDRVGLSEARIGLRAQEETSVELVGLNWIGSIGLIRDQYPVV
jgi:hypothetical protein